MFSRRVKAVLPLLVLAAMTARVAADVPYVPASRGGSRRRATPSSLPPSGRGRGRGEPVS